MSGSSDNNSNIRGFMSSPSRSPARSTLDISNLPSLTDTNDSINSTQLLSELSNDLKLGTSSTRRIFKTPAQIGGLKKPKDVVQKIQSSAPNSVLVDDDLYLPLIDEKVDKNMTSPVGFIENENILIKLTDNEFMPMNNIMITDMKGNEEVKYIKVTDSRGNISYVLIDIDGNVMRTSSDVNTSIVENVTSIPLSVKIGLYECAKLDVCGVAMECEGGVCMLSRNDDDEMEELTLSKSSSDGEHFAVESGSYVGYPIVKLSEILDNPILVAKIIDDTTNRIQKNSINNYLSEIEAFEESQNDAVESTNQFKNKITNKIRLVKSNLVELDKVRTRYDLSPPKTDVEKDKMRRNAYLIKQHNELFNNLITISQNLKRYQKIFNDISNDAKEINQLVDDVVMETQETFST